MRIHRAALLAFGLGVSSSSFAADLDRVHLPGPLGRYLGIGYGPGYHAHRPSHARVRAGSTSSAWHPGMSISNLDLYEPVSYSAQPTLVEPRAMDDSSTSEEPASQQPAAPLTNPSNSSSSTPSPTPVPPAAAAPAGVTPRRTPAAADSQVSPGQPSQPSASASGRGSSFSRRLPTTQGSSSILDLSPPPPASSKKASVARASGLELDAR